MGGPAAPCLRNRSSRLPSLQRHDARGLVHHTARDHQTHPRSLASLVSRLTQAAARAPVTPNIRVALSPGRGWQPGGGYLRFQASNHAAHELLAFGLGAFRPRSTGRTPRNPATTQALRALPAAGPKTKCLSLSAYPSRSRASRTSASPAVSSAVMARSVPSWLNARWL